jgi:serine protease AprX
MSASAQQSSPETTASPRYFIRMRHPSQMAALAPMAATANAYRSKSHANILIAELEPRDVEKLNKAEVEVIPSRRYEPLQLRSRRVQIPLDTQPFSLTDVLAQTRASEAWAMSRGAGVSIAMVDTGICGTMPEFAGTKKSQFRWAGPGQGDPWTDQQGHGSMTASIAAGSTASGGRYNGVAPDSPIIACKTSFDDTELYQIYDYLIQLVSNQQIGRLVVSNSYGSYVCAPPPVTREDPFPSIVALAVSKGIVVVFAAGNNHVVICGNDPTQCSPNTIWSANSMDEVLSIGTVNRNNRMDQPPATPGGYSHRDSSRGPGQLAQSSTKPDCVAPTYGDVMWGCGYNTMEWWGTSGAAPQVAGLAALMLAKNSALTPAQIQTIIRNSCVNIGLPPTCAGAGLIDCAAAVNAA